MIWLWVVALGATLAGLIVALRGLTRADAAVAALQAAVVAVDPVPDAGAALDQGTAIVAHQRSALGHRSAPPR